MKTIPLIKYTSMRLSKPIKKVKWWKYLFSSVYEQQDLLIKPHPQSVIPSIIKHIDTHILYVEEPLLIHPDTSRMVRYNQVSDKLYKIQVNTEFLSKFRLRYQKQDMRDRLMGREPSLQDLILDWMDKNMGFYYKIRKINPIELYPNEKFDIDFEIVQRDLFGRRLPNNCAGAFRIKYFNSPLIYEDFDLTFSEDNKVLMFTNYNIKCEPFTK